MIIKKRLAPSFGRQTALLLALAIVLLHAAGAGAAQFIVLDKDYIHSKWYYHESFPWQPADWTSPDDYAAGTAYFRVEVRGLKSPIDGWYSTNTNQSSPPDFIAGYFSPQLCLFQDAHIPSKHACFSSGTIKFDGPGVYYGSQRLPDMYQYGVIDWTRLLMNPMVIGKTQGPTGLSYYGQKANMRFTVIIVAAGDVFQPPSWWDVAADVDDPDSAVPERTRLVGNYPNPFNPATTIRFDLAAPATVTLRVYDLAGHAVRTLIEAQSMPQGRFEAVWRGRDDAGRPAPGGVYLARLEAPGVIRTLQLTLLK